MKEAVSEGGPQCVSLLEVKEEEKRVLGAKSCGIHLWPLGMTEVIVP